VAITATDFPFADRVMRRQAKLAAFIKVALETSLRVLSWVDDRVAGAAAFRMNAAWAVTGFTSHLRRVWTFRLNTCVGGCLKVSSDVFVTLRAILRTNQRGAWNLGWHDHSPVQCGAGDNGQDEPRGAEPQRDQLCVSFPPGHFNSPFA